MNNTQSALEEAMSYALDMEACKLRGGTTTGVCITVIPSTVNRTYIRDQEWINDLFLRYIIDPPELPIHYNGCNTELYICYAFDYKKDGLIMTHHKTCYIPRRPVCSHSMVCSKNYLFIVGIGPIYNKEL